MLVLSDYDIELSNIDAVVKRNMAVISNFSNIQEKMADEAKSSTLLRTKSRVKTKFAEQGDHANENENNRGYFDDLFHIPDLDTRNEKKASLKTKIKRKFGLYEKMTEEEFEFLVSKICNYCLKNMKDLHELHVNRTKALHCINDLILRMEIDWVQPRQVVHLIWSIMSCIHHFQLRYKLGSNLIITWTRKMKAEECMNTYIKLINVLPRQCHRTILNSLITFYKEGKLWTIEFRLTDMICELLYLYQNIEEALEDILAEQSSLRSAVEPRQLIKVLSEVLENLRWNHLSVEMITRFLVMLRRSIVQKPEYTYYYVPMRMSLNVCIRNITKNLCNRDLMNMIILIVKLISLQSMEDDALLSFGSIVEYAALKYHSKKFSDSLPLSLFKYILALMVSKSIILHLISHRILINLIDRKDNKIEFETPRIFFKGVSYNNIKIARYSASDRSFFKKQRLNVHKCLMEGLKNHYDHKINLENIYTSLAILCVEVPCAYVASSVVSLCMAMQDHVLQTKPPDMVAGHHVHSVIMSLMSLVCYVHKAEVFNNYVTLIMERRSEWAPHLNPPIKVRFAYAQHHILWDKPDLFFEDWEARYGLWKCFRTKKKPISTEDLTAAKTD